LVNQQLKAAHRKLDELCAQLIPSEENEPGQQCEPRDVVILRSMPGLGRIILAVLLAEVWQPLRRRDYHALRSLSGVAPVTRRSGKTCVVVRRYACNKRLANALYHWARLATQRDAASGAQNTGILGRLPGRPARFDQSTMSTGQMTALKGTRIRTRDTFGRRLRLNSPPRLESADAATSKGPDTADRRWAFPVLVVVVMAKHSLELRNSSCRR
jgi:Transposase IS116/IS110/IS902 family